MFADTSELRHPSGESKVRLVRGHAAPMLQKVLIKAGLKRSIQD